MTKLTHLDPEGRPVMVDVSPKAITRRVAVAAGYLELDEPAAQALAQVGGPKGDPWSAVLTDLPQGYGLRAHDRGGLPLAIEAVAVAHHWDASNRRAWLRVQVSCEGRTGIEMEALAGVTIGLLVLYDMLKAVSHGMAIGPVRLLHKEGGRRGTLTMPWDECPWNPGPSEG